VMSLITMINHWHYAVPEEHLVPRHEEPGVAVIIPTYGEPTLMVYETARSVLEQDYPEEEILLFVSDDGHRDAIRLIVRRLQQEHPHASIHYHEPPRRGDRRRREKPNRATSTRCST
jgi:cellulose synthase/poly-beta-1,6-N-acetylglucosamine synthase-like glycosyltransferase